MTKLWCITFFLVVAVSGSRYVEGKSVLTSALLRTLIAKEDANVRPNADETGMPVLVNVSLTITNLEQLTDKVDTMRAQGYILFKWNDPRLTWDTSDYANQNVRIPISAIWIPDVTLYNNADQTTSVFSKEQQHALVYPNGNVIWAPKTTLTFNYNTTEGNGQTLFAARLLLGSWVYSSDDLDVKAESASVEPVPEGFEFNQFVIKKSTIERKVIHYPCCTEDYPRLDINLLIEKREK